MLVAGGDAPTAPERRRTEIFDPGAGTWALAGDMAVDRGIASGTLLADGRVLAAGGNAVSTAELFDPATGLWSPTGPLSGERYYHSATLLPSGKVIVAGGYWASEPRHDRGLRPRRPGSGRPGRRSPPRGGGTRPR